MWTFSKACATMLSWSTYNQRSVLFVVRYQFTVSAKGQIGRKLAGLIALLSSFLIMPIKGSRKELFARMYNF